MKVPAPPPGTQAVLRAIALLKSFSEDHPEMSLTDLSERLGLSKATAHRLLGALQSEELIARNPLTNDYRLGPALIALGSRALRTSDLRETVRPELERLADETGETATLEVLADGQMLILDEVRGRHLVGAAPWVGTRWPLHATSTGKALLAQLPENEARDWLAPPLAAYTEHTCTDLETLLAALAAVRRRGFAVAIEELEPGSSAVAAAVRGADGPIAAISVGGPLSRLGPDDVPLVGAAVKAAAERVSRRMGHDG